MHGASDGGGKRYFGSRQQHKLGLSCHRDPSPSGIFPPGCSLRFSLPLARCWITSTARGYALWLDDGRRLVARGIWAFIPFPILPSFVPLFLILIIRLFLNIHAHMCRHLRCTVGRTVDSSEAPSGGLFPLTSQRKTDHPVIPSAPVPLTSVRSTCVR